MDLNEFIDRLKLAQEHLPQLLLQSYIDVAHDAKAMIEARVVETGTNAHGTTFESIKPYSLQYLKVKQNFTLGGSGKVKAGKKKDKKGNALQGRYRGKVDFLLTGNMWGNINVLTDISNVTARGVIVSVGARNEDNINKLAGNVYGNGKWSGRGEILELSESELEILAGNLELNLQDHFNSFFL